MYTSPFSFAGYRDPLKAFAMASLPPTLYFLSLIFTKHLFFFSVVSSLRFSYYPSITDEHTMDFIYAHGSNLAGGALQITMDSRNAPLENQSGRVLHKRTFKLWKDGRSVVASFNTTFVLNILPLTDPGGEGLAMIFTNNLTLPSNSHGRWLGIVNKETNGLASNHIVAVEFDTHKSSSADSDGNHVAVDVNSINSIFQFPIARSEVKLSSGMDVVVRISYDGKLHFMTVNLTMGNETRINNSNPSFSFPIDLSEFLMEDVYVGFSASTSNLTQLNCIRSWNFSSTAIGGNSWAVKHKWILGVFIGALAILVGSVVTVYVCWMKRCANFRGSRSRIDLSVIQGCTPGGSKSFRLRELVSATLNFDPSKELGRGGFGIVYHGFLRRGPGHVAIKRLNKDSCQREQEFLSEVTTIGTLRHENLVKLIGWCSENDELLLVYEYLPNGSLDKHIFPNLDVQDTTPLNWEKRFNILCGVASALCYLHDDRNHKRVFHRDVKASNVMLDAEYNALLGDFGLARTVEDDGKTHHTTKVLAGTACYVAPEYCANARATMKTDIYAFGALTMEVARGTKPIVNHLNYSENNLVNQVWDLYGEDKILDAADVSLRGVFDAVQMEIVLKLGLACCHPDEYQRPISCSVVKILKGEERVPDISRVKPSFVSPDSASTSSRSIPMTLEELLTDTDQN